MVRYIKNSAICRISIYFSICTEKTKSGQSGKIWTVGNPSYKTCFQNLSATAHKRGNILSTTQPTVQLVFLRQETFTVNVLSALLLTAMFTGPSCILFIHMYSININHKPLKLQNHCFTVARHLLCYPVKVSKTYATPFTSLSKTKKFSS
jgi:hypothetical protein